MSATGLIQTQLQRLVSTTLKRVCHLAIGTITVGLSLWVLCVFLCAAWTTMQGAEVWIGYAVGVATILSLTLSLALWLINRTLQRRPYPPKWALQLAQHLAPEQGSGLQTVFAFLVQPSASAPSADLLAWHSTQVATCLEQANLGQRLRDKTAASVQRLRLATLILMGITLAVVAWTPQTAQTLWQHWRDRDATVVSDTTLIEQIDLRYTYPAYTHKAPKILESSDGQIEALRQTSVAITIHTDKIYSTVWLEVEPDNSLPSQRIFPDSHAHNVFTFQYLVTRSSRYRFVVAPSRGRNIADSIWHPVHATDDAPPAIYVDYPQQDITIDDDTTLQILWHADDDYGLTDVTLMLDLDGHPSEHHVLWQPDPNTLETQIEQSSTWPFARADFHGQETLSFCLCAHDNDPLSVDKKTCSTARHVHLFSAQTQHQKTQQDIQRFIDALVDTLASQIELQSKINTSAEKLSQDTLAAYKLDPNGIMQIAETTASACQSDSLIDPALAAGVYATEKALLRHQALWNTLDPHQFTSNIRKVNSALVTTLEQHIIYLDDLLGLSAMHDTQRQTQDLLTEHHRLQESLRDYKANPDDAHRQALKNHFAELKQKMQETLMRLSTLKKALDAEFQNIEGASMQHMQSQIEKLEKQLEHEDLEQAAQEMESLASMLEQMANNLERGEKQYGAERYSKIRQQLEQFASDFRQIEQDQQKLRDQTQHMLEDNMQKSMRASAPDPQAWIEKARQHAQQGMQALSRMKQQATLSPHFAAELQQAAESYQNIDLLLAHGQLLAAQALVEQNQDINQDLVTRVRMFRDAWSNRRHDPPAKMLGYAKVASDHANKLASMFADLQRLNQDFLAQSQQEPIRRLQQKQSTITKKSEDLQQLMQMLQEQLPMFDPSTQTTLKRATDLMQQARDDLENRQLAQASTHNAQTVQQLEQLRKALEQASQHQGTGLPLPIGQPIYPHQNAQARSTPEAESKVRIPKQNNQNAGPRFKQELLQAAQQQAAQDYEDAVRAYYNKLIR